MTAESVNNETALQTVVPSVDIVEMDDGFHIYMDMPGVRKEDLLVDLDKNEVTVGGKASYAKEITADAGKNVLHAEFGPGEYKRSFTLSDAVDREKITAKLTDGVLNLFLPKSEATKPKRIEITAG